VAAGSINVQYASTGLPVSVGTSGQRSFCSDQSGVIHYNTAGTSCSTGTDSALQ
jgi:hypothetical protein